MNSHDSTKAHLTEQSSPPKAVQGLTEEQFREMEEGRRAIESLQLHGYRRCDISACNCGGWHGGNAAARLREIREAFDEAGIDRNGKALLQLVQAALSAAPGVQAEQQWISVKDALPEEHEGSVAVLFDDGEPGVGWPTYWHGASRWFARWSFPLDDLADGREVTYWCRLPPEPKKLPQDFHEQQGGKGEGNG